MDLTGWSFIRTYGDSLDLYGYGCLRVAIDRNSGRKVVSYVMRKKQA